MTNETPLRRHARRLLGVTLAIALVSGCADATITPSSTPANTAGPTAPTPIATSTASPSLSAATSVGPTASPSPAAPKSEGQIVFFDYAVASPHQQVYIERADGSDARRLSVSDFDDVKPRLSPDGRTVAFTRYGPVVSNIVLVNVDGTNERVIDTVSCAKACGGDEDVSWSPDGTRLIVTRNLMDPSGNASTWTSPINVALWVMRADGTGAHQLTLKNRVCHDVCKGGAQDNRAAWSPDGKRIAFTRDAYTKPEQYGIFTIGADGSDLRRVTPITMNVDDPAWSPDGNLIAFQSPPEPTEGVIQSIYTIHPDGTGLKELTGSLGLGGSNGASWSPDGRHIVFSHFPGMNGVADLYVMNSDGSDMHAIAETPLNENSPFWGVSPTH